MNTSLLDTRNGTVSYGATSESFRPDHAPTLNLLGISYTVKERVGPWWKGACLRPIKHKTVLNSITMQVKAGELTAILGNSGSGKTSLLDVITCRHSGTVTGKVYYRNFEVDKTFIKQNSTYVMQADRLLSNLTVRETLQYTARLKMPRNSTEKEIKAKVNRVIMEMGLKNVADSRVGGSIIRGISGGERRRVTIAIQLLRDPEMIFLDEPTSGLDSYTARYLVSNLADMAHRGKIVLLTIHQPSSDIFKMFDKIGIMTTGDLVYFGPGSEIVPYFTHLGYPCPTYANPLDHYVDLASIDRRDPDLEFKTTERVRSLVTAFTGSALHLNTTESVVEETLSSSYVHGSTVDAGRKSKKPTVFRVQQVLQGRMMINLFRDRKDYIARIFFLPLFFVFILLFLGRLKDNQKSIQDRIGLLYQSSTVPSYIGLFNAYAMFPALRNLYYREHRDGLYSGLEFLVAYSCHIIPFHIVSSLIFSAVVYWVPGMYPDAGRFGLFLATVILVAFWGEMLTALVMCIIMSPQQAQSTCALVQAASVVIGSGFLKVIDSMVDPLKWLGWIFIHKYVGEILVANEFQDLDFQCTNGTVCIPSGNFYIDKFYPGAVEHMERNFGATAGTCVAMVLLAALAFQLKGRNLH